MSSCLIVPLGSPAPPRTLLQGCRDAGVTPLTPADMPDGHLPTARQIDALVVVGGPVSPYDERESRLHTLGPLVARMVAREKPLLGIGGGAHLVSVALGGRPTGGTDSTPVRFRPLTVTEAAATDPLFRHVGEGAEWAGCSHLVLGDLPVGAQVLAVGEDGDAEAVRLGERAWLLQGHPEADPSLLDDLPGVCVDPSVLPAEDREQILDRLRRDDETWTRMLQAFFDEVDGCPARP